MNHKYSIENAMEKVDEKTYFLYDMSVELEIFQIRQETKKFVPILLWIHPQGMPWSCPGVPIGSVWFFFHIMGVILKRLDAFLVK